MVEHIEIRFVVANKANGDYLKGGYVACAPGGKPNPSWERDVTKSFIKFPDYSEAVKAADAVDGEVFEMRTTTRITVTKVKI